jgi:hypothetical protein
MRIALVSVLFLAQAGTAIGQAPTSAGGLRVRDSVLVLPDGRTFVPGLQQLRAHGYLGAPEKFVVLSGFGCEDCDAVRSIYVMRFGEHLNWNKRPWPPVFAFPGTTRDTENRVVAQSRLFVGRCDSDSALVVIQFARTRRSTNRWADSIHVAALKGDSIVTASTTHTRARLDQVLERVRGGSCVEVPPDHKQVES